MEAFRPTHAHQAHVRTSHLTKLYSDVKKSADTNFSVHPLATQQFAALQRKYRIQKDRLITWGLAWSDDEKGVDGNIDDSVARAGLTETVDSVLRNIKEVTEEAERIKSAGFPLGTIGLGGDSKIAAKQPAEFDEARYEDLLRDLTTSIDILYDLSLSRRALARGEHPNFSASSVDRSVSDVPDKPQTIRRKPLSRNISYASSDLTLVNPPPFRRPNLSPYAGLPPRIDISALQLPHEGPPPYESIGVPSTTRLVAHLLRNRASEGIHNILGSSTPEVPVFVEYANFDSIYRDTHVPPPLQRLEALANFIPPMRPESQTSLSLLGYFEDPNQPRLGLVYDVPYSLQNRLQGTHRQPAQVLAPISLLKMMQRASKGQATNGEIVTPALESRYQLALRLTEQLQDMHVRGMPHGNINSSSVVFMTTVGESPLKQSLMRSPHWSAFDLFSKCSVEGVRRDANLNIYKHPQDFPQSPKRDLGADIKFDLYGLALILLEVGLWVPIGTVYKEKYSLADFKLRLEKLWIPKLAAKCGSVYMRVVEACLRIADEPDTSHLTVDGVYGSLLEKLRRCCLLDEDDMASDPLTPSNTVAEATKMAYAGSTFTKHRSSSPEPGHIKRMQSNPDAILRSSMMTPIESPHRMSSMPIVASTNSPLSAVHERQMSRQTSTHSRMSHQDSMTDIKGRSTHHFTTKPSFKEYKQKVTLIQQRWREYRERRKQAAHKAEQLNTSTRGIEPDSDHDAKPKRKEFPSVKLPQALQEEWQSKLAFQLANIVERALHGCLESSSINLTAYGETPETARPTLLVCCKSTAKVKQALRRHFKYDANVYDVRVKKDEIRRCRKSSRTTDRAARRSMAPASALDRARNPDYQARPLCGASIGAFRDDEHLPPVSFGGVVLVDGMPFGMSVHHMLEAEDDEDEAVDGDVDDDDDDDTSSIGSADLAYPQSDDDDSTVRPSTLPEIDQSVYGHDGDMPGITPEDFEEIAVTQPSLDDAIDLDLHVDEDEDSDSEDSGIDEDHLLSYKLGQIHASSGLKRSAALHSTQEGFRSISQSLPQEIDWALFELVPPRVHPFNIVKGGRQHCSSAAAARSSSGPDSYPVAIRRSGDLACAKVHCLGRTSGLATGVISSTMELVKIHGRSTFSASWTVDGGFGVGGDSGAWVIANDDGRVCGHVLASRRGKTYICPMDLLLEDVRRTLGAMEVTLPSVSAMAAAATPLDGVANQQNMNSVAEQTVLDAMGRMRINEHEMGGVALPISPTKRSGGIRRPPLATVEPV
ncbi:Hypothetical protein R9X50_00610800 [Acrodontium crateriforme]|uniref:Protein kinase domain-containing protein n=1 Tax=Acrodontium crateriforme TaxID=150365 RepID=A0AAQ3R6I7_9PEZI|nr:Hypothetical protein R9X50_00610800 [Acrodontium crateriforme]